MGVEKKQLGQAAEKKNKEDGSRARAAGGKGRGDEDSKDEDGGMRRWRTTRRKTKTTRNKGVENRSSCALLLLVSFASALVGVSCGHGETVRDL